MSPGAALLTVVIPAYQAAAYVDRSLRSALDQPGVEVVVVDDGSTDGTSEVVESVRAELARRGIDDRLRVVRQANAGLAGARNAGLGQVRTPFVGFLDADDVLEPGWAEAVTAALEAGADLAVADAYVFGDDGVRGPGSYYTETAFPEADQAGELLRRNFVLSTCAARTDALRAVGGFPVVQSARGGAEDWATWQSLVLAGGRIGLVPEVLSGYRRGHASMSADIERMKSAEIALLLDRRAQLAGRPELRRAVDDGLRRLRGDLMLHRVRTLSATSPRRAAVCSARAAGYLRHRRHVKASVLLAFAPNAGLRYVRKML